MPPSTRKPRVLIVGPTLQQTGGVGMFTEVLLGSTLSERFTLRHLNTTRGKAGAGKVATWHPINFAYFGRQALQLLVILATWHPDLMHQPITGRVSFWKEAALMLLARLFGVRVIGHLHGNDFFAGFERQGWITRRLTRRALHLPHVIIALSEGWRRILLENVAADLTIAVVPSVIPPAFAALAEDPAPVERRDPCTVLYLGSLGTRKGLLDALRAVPLVRAGVPEARFVFAGALELGRERPLVERACAEAQAHGGVSFPGRVNDDEKLALYREASLFILPSYRENFPSSVLEAMAAGLPVVVTPVGALTELLQDGVNGYFVAPGDDRALARRIVELARDPVLREAMGRANRARVRGAFTPAIVFGQIGDLYAQVLNGDLAGARLSSQEAPHESAS